MRFRLVGGPSTLHCFHLNCFLAESSHWLVQPAQTDHRDRHSPATADRHFPKFPLSIALPSARRPASQPASRRWQSSFLCFPRLRRLRWGRRPARRCIRASQQPQDFRAITSTWTYVHVMRHPSRIRGPLWSVVFLAKFPRRCAIFCRSGPSWPAWDREHSNCRGSNRLKNQVLDSSCNNEFQVIWAQL